MSQEPAELSHKGSGRPLLVGGAVGFVLAGLVVVGLMATGLLSGGSAQSSTHEGKGYESPEEAAVAYVEALRDQDLTTMQQAYAIESYVELCDYGAFVERIGAHTWHGAVQSCPFPPADSVGEQANIAVRSGAVAQAVVAPLASVVSPHLSDTNNGLILNEEGAVAEFQSQVAADFADNPFARAQNIQTVAPGELSDVYDSDRNLDYVAMIAQAAGLSGTDYVNVAVTFDVDGKEWVFAPAVGRYHDRWYLVTPQGTLAQLLGFPAQSGGFGALEN